MHPRIKDALNELVWGRVHHICIVFEHVWGRVHRIYLVSGLRDAGRGRMRGRIRSGTEVVCPRWSRLSLSALDALPPPADPAGTRPLVFVVFGFVPSVRKSPSSLPQGDTRAVLCPRVGEFMMVVQVVVWFADGS